VAGGGGGDKEGMCGKEGENRMGIGRRKARERRRRCADSSVKVVGGGGAARAGRDG
jgi:hypothetical protein